MFEPRNWHWYKTINSGTDLSQILPVFTCTVGVSRVLWNCITYVEWKNYHHNQDTELVHHHKETPRATPIVTPFPNPNHWQWSFLHHCHFVSLQMLYKWAHTVCMLLIQQPFETGFLSPSLMSFLHFSCMERVCAFLLLKSVPWLWLYHSLLPIHPSKNIWLVSSFKLVQIKLL